MERQFVVQLENRPGELAHLARALADRGIDIRNICCTGSGQIACVFLTTSDSDDAFHVLRGLGCEFIEGETIVVDVADRPGGLADVTERLARSDVNILGTLVIGQRAGLLEMAFAVDDVERAKLALAVPSSVAVDV